MHGQGAERDERAAKIPVCRAAYRRSRKLADRRSCTIWCGAGTAVSGCMAMAPEKKSNAATDIQKIENQQNIEALSKARTDYATIWEGIHKKAMLMASPLTYTKDIFFRRMTLL